MRPPYLEIVDAANGVVIRRIVVPPMHPGGGTGVAA